MLFKSEFREGLESGSITLTFRRWARPRVKVGGQYRVSPAGVLVVDRIDVVRAGDISSAEARRSGFPDRTALRAELEGTGRAAPTDGLEVVRVAFHYAAQPDERDRLAGKKRLSDVEVAGIAEHLRRTDALSKHGRWTDETLKLVRDHPGVAASKLAARVGRETQPFKADVRKLKQLGLTLSLDVGYRLSPRGKTYLRRSAAARPR